MEPVVVVSPGRHYSQSHTQRGALYWALCLLWEDNCFIIYILDIFNSVSALKEIYLNIYCSDR